MKNKLHIFIVIVVLIAFFGSCGSSDDMDEDGEDKFMGTLTATKSGVTYTLTINPEIARNAIGPSVGDAYVLSVKKGNEEQISTGKITIVSGSVLTLQPSSADASPFNVTFTGTKITKVTETITFDDGKTMQGPGSVTTSGGGGGGGGNSSPQVPGPNIRIVSKPAKKNYQMCEEIDITGLVVEYVYANGSTVVTKDYYISGDTFTSGYTRINVVSKENASITASFDINVSNELINTGLPVMYIDTLAAAPINSKVDYVNMKVKVVDSEHPEWSFEKTDYNDQIRGRGNTSWGYPKKPYRIKFDKKTSMFGLTAAKNWVLLANYKVATLIADTVAFEVGQRFDGTLFKNHYMYVDVVLNGVYQGTYILTEHMRVAEGRVEIDETNDFLVELDVYYDENPKFRTLNLNLPVMISSPDFGTNINDPRYRFVIDSFYEFDTVLSDKNFPENGWKDIIDIDSFVDYLMINEIVQNGELSHPKSVYMCKTAGGKIRMSHLWDFDWAFGMGENTSVDVSTAKSRYTGGWFFSRFHKDNEFTAEYKARWNEKYHEIQTIPVFIDKIAEQIRISHSLDNRRWHGNTYNFDKEINKLKTWWNDRIFYLNSEINK